MKHFRSAVLFLALTVITAAQTATIATLPTITGDGAAHQLATSGSARWVQFVATTGNAAAVRVGDSLTSATRGIPVAAGGGWLFPPMPVDTRMSGQASLYKLSTIYYYAASSDTLNVVIGQ